MNTKYVYLGICMIIFIMFLFVAQFIYPSNPDVKPIDFNLRLVQIEKHIEGSNDGWIKNQYSIGLANSNNEIVFDSKSIGLSVFRQLHFDVP